MKILHLSSERTWRGGEQQIAYLIDELQKQEVLNFVACRESSAFETYCKKEKIPFVSMPFSSFSIKTAFLIKKTCKQNNIDLIHIHTSRGHTIALLSWFLGCKTLMVLSRRVDFDVASNWFSHFKYNHSSIKKIICISEKIREIVTKSVKRTDKCITVHSGVDLSRFNKPCNGVLRKRYNVPDDFFVVGNISAIAPHKDYHTFVEVASLVVKENSKVRFFIIGDGPQRLEIEELISRKNLNDCITLTGFIENIPEILPCLDAFLITSKTEGLGTTVLDAFAAGVPVVATAAGGIPEMVRNNETGMLAEVGNVEALAKHILNLSGNITKREELAKRAKFAVKQFSKEKMALENLKVYKAALDNL